MKDGQYVVIQAFMVNDLQLKGNELIVYATIFGFTQDGEHWFYGTKGYLAEWCGATKGTVGNCLKSLTKKGLLERREKIQQGQVRIEYRATKFVIHPHKNCDTPHTNFAPINNIEIQPSEQPKENIPFSEIIDYLNERAGTRYRPTAKKAREYISARWSEGYTLDNFKRVIDNMCARWKGTEWEQYLQPSTLFAPSHFDEYLNKPTKTKKETTDGIPDYLREYRF